MQTDENIQITEDLGVIATDSDPSVHLAWYDGQLACGSTAEWLTTPPVVLAAEQVCGECVAKWAADTAHPTGEPPVTQQRVADQVAGWWRWHDADEHAWFNDWVGMRSQYVAVLEHDAATATVRVAWRDGSVEQVDAIALTTWPAHRTDRN